MKTYVSGVLVFGVIFLENRAVISSLVNIHSPETDIVHRELLPVIQRTGSASQVPLCSGLVCVRSSGGRT